MTKVFIDGREGTTGLRIWDRLSAREDIELILLPEADRKIRTDGGKPSTKAIFLFCVCPTRRRRRPNG